ncbi:MAG: hypothetical protein HQL70_08335 [Magnetococcales bacterium]|nr:hypothetical protein [Magnetococcales bacterium]
MLDHSRKNTFILSFLIDDLDEESIDIFVYKNILGEMRKATINHFIPRIAKVRKYFLIINHESFLNIFKNEKRSIICLE